MPIKAIYDEKPTEAITLSPDDFVEVDGKWMPNVEPVGDTRLEDVGKLRATLQKANAKAANQEKRLKLFGDHTPESIAELSARADAASEGGDIDERVNAEVAIREKALRDKLEQDAQSQKAEYDSLKTSWINSERDRRIIEAMSKAGAPSDLLPIYREKIKAEMVDSDGEKSVAVKVLDDNGTVRLTEQPGKTDEMTIGEFVASYKDHPTWGSTFKAAEIKGDDAPAPNRQVKQPLGAGRVSADDQDALDANWEKIASGEVVVE